MSVDSLNSHAFNPLSSQEHLSLPEHMKLKKVVIFTRHGDRSQISRSMGDNFPENENWSEIWKSKLPSQTTTLKLHDVARHINVEIESSDTLPNVYVGWDSIYAPYGMLTQIGVQQLQNLGASLRTRYFDLLIQHNETKEHPSFSSSIYCRSTNMCRTILSLRSFLTGFLQTDLTQGNKSPTHHPRKPVIVRRHKLTETLYPQADGPCHGISQRREHLFSDNFVQSKILSDYESFEKKIKTILGFENQPVNWLVVKEVLTCHTVHGIPLPEGITDEDIDKATVIAATMWGRLYNVSVII